MITSAVERQHIVDQLDKNRRSGGRSKNEFRDIRIETNVIGTANGSAIVHIGKTKVIAGVKAVIGTPYSDAPNKGSIMVGFETSPLSAPEYRYGPPQDEAIEIARMTDRVIRESGCIDLEALCIKEGEKVWTIIIDLYSLDHYGNFYDAASLAAIAALSCTTIPEVTIDDDGNVEQLETSYPLKLNSFPVTVTTSKIGNHYLVDANLKEEKTAEARITFGTTDTHIVSGQKGGEVGIKSADILTILEDSIRTASLIREQVREQLGLEE